MKQKFAVSKGDMYVLTAFAISVIQTLRTISVRKSLFGGRFKASMVLVMSVEHVSDDYVSLADRQRSQYMKGLCIWADVNSSLRLGNPALL